MKWLKCVSLIGLGLLLSSLAYGDQQKQKIFVVSSYHKSYLWSQSTQKGLTDAMLNYGYLDNIQQAKDFTKNDHVESSKGHR